MDVTLDEQKLLADFRRLDPAAKKEVLDFAAARLMQAEPAAEETNGNRCRIEKQEQRPEIADEPVFTE